MPSTQDYCDFVLDQLSRLSDITSRKMMGESILYYKGKIFGGIYDNRFLVKPVKAAKKMMPDAPLEVPYPMSWNDEERDTSCWLGNVMQREAFQKLYSVAERVLICKDRRITQDWDRIQASNNFRFMTTKNMGVGFYRGIYDSPYDAFTNYMNILGDFINRVNALYPLDIDNDELESLLTTIKNQGDEIEMKDKEITRLKARLEKLEPAEKPAKKPAAKKAAAKKTASKA